MRYTYFEFKNFKGIRHARLDLSPGSSAANVYTLVGLNESGKTTVLEAIDQFRVIDGDGISPKQLSGWQNPDPYALIPIAERDNFNGRVTITAGIELDDDDIAAAKQYAKAEDGYRLSELNREIEISDHYDFENSNFQKSSSTWKGLQGKGKTKKGKILRDLAAKESKKQWQDLATFLRGQLPTIWYFPNFLFDFPEKIYLEPTEGEKPPAVFYRDLFQDILNALEKDLTAAKHVVERARSSKESDKSSLESVLLQAGRHVTDTVVAAWNEIFTDKPLSDQNVRIEVGTDEPAPVGEGEQPQPAPVWIRFQLEDADGMFSLGERSLGFRWFFVYLILTTYRGRRDESQNMLFLLDEPASNLHPAAQSALLHSLEDLGKRATVIFSTHSHHLIEPNWLGTTFVVENRGLSPDEISPDYKRARTDIKITPYRQFVAEHPDQTRFFQPILDVLDYAPSKLEDVPDAVLVEGKTDFYLLAYYQEVVLGLKAKERLALIPGGGAGSLDKLIQLYLGWSRPFVALLDADKTGRKEAERYLKKFGLLLKPQLLLLDDASGNPDCKSIESLLAETEKLRFQNVAAPGSKKYDKKLMHRGVQEALVGKVDVSLNQATRKVLDKILESLRNVLEL